MNLRKRLWSKTPDICITQKPFLILVIGFPKKITLIGGGAKNIQWAKILSSLLDVKILVPENQDYVTSIGAIRLALKNLTMWAVRVLPLEVKKIKSNFFFNLGNLF